MSAKRISLLAAAIVCGVLTPTTSCWAQAYGAANLVEHNDLRFFEPVELDLDGQMPRADSGFFFTADKLWWSVGVPKTEIGSPGLIVDSERIFPANPVPLAISALEQVEGFNFIDDAAEAVAFSGIAFATFDDMNTPFRRDDVEQVLGLDQAMGVVDNSDRLNFAFRQTAGDPRFFGRQVATGIADDPGTPGIDESVRTVTSIETVADLEAALGFARTGFDVRNANGIRVDVDGDPETIGGVANPAFGGAVAEAGQNIRTAGEPQPYGVQNSIRDAMPDAGFAWGERFEFGRSDGERGWMVTILDGPESQSGAVFGAGEGALFFSQTNDEFYGADRFFLGDLEDDGLDGEGDGDGEQGAVDIFAFGFGSVAVNFELPNADFLKGFRDYNNGDTPFTTSGPIMYVGNYGSTFTELIVTALNLQGGAPSLGEINTAFGAASGNAFSATAGVGLNSLNLLNTALTTFGSTNPGLLAPVTDAQTILNLLIANPVFPVGGVGGFADRDAAIAGLNAAFTNISTAANAVGAVAGLANQTVTTNNIDRLADDLNGNGNQGVINVIGQVNGVNQVVGQIFDYGDLHTFNVFFDQVTVRNTTEVDGVELMRFHELSTAHKMQQGRWDGLRLSYGVRFMNVEDDFYFQGLGSILGRTTVETSVENQVVGPQIGMQWIRRDGPWDFLVEARGTVGYNIVDIDQSGIFGEELIPGALNRPVTARTTTSVDGSRYDEFSPLGELRAQLRYRLAKSVTLQAGYTAKFIGNIHRAGDSTRWAAPSFGIHDHTGDIFINGLNIGVELRH